MPKVKCNCGHPETGQGHDPTCAVFVHCDHDIEAGPQPDSRRCRKCGRTGRWVDGMIRWDPTLREYWDKARVLWAEDECTEDGETFDHAWCRLFGEPRPQACIREEDWGDCEVAEYGNGRMAMYGPRRGEYTQIRVFDYSKPT